MVYLARGKARGFYKEHDDYTINISASFVSVWHTEFNNTRDFKTGDKLEVKISFHLVRWIKINDSCVNVMISNMRSGRQTEFTRPPA